LTFLIIPQITGSIPYYLYGLKYFLYFSKKNGMNLSKSAFRRYKVIDSLLRNPMKRYPAMDDIIDACERHLDFAPSVETIQKDLANMRLPYPDGFDAPIYFNRTHGGYEYTDPDFSIAGVSLRPDEMEAIREAAEVIRSIGGTRLSDKINHAVEKILSTSLEGTGDSETNSPILQTMVPPVSRGFEHFDLFYKACRERHPVSFIHFGYKKRNFSHILLHPFLIKEFDNRWYVIGYSEKHQAIRTFGLDRVSEPLLLKKKFHELPATATRAYLHDVYGVFPIPDAKKETVKIRVTRLGTYYFLAYPIHTTQVVQKDSDGSSVITFQVVPSLELARYFLGQGRHVQILSPKWFHQFTKELVK